MRAVSPWITGSGTVNVSPKRELKRAASVRVSSTCCFWSSPTGTDSAWNSRMSAAISTGYVNRATLVASSPYRRDLSLNCVMRPASPKPVDRGEDPRELGVRRNLRLHVQRRLLGLDAGRDVLRGRAAGLLAQLLRILWHGDRVQVDHREERVEVVLHAAPLHQRTDVVADLERIGGRLHS